MSNPNQNPQLLNQSQKPNQQSNQPARPVFQQQKPEEPSNTRAWIIAGVIIVLLIGGSWWMIARRSGSDATDAVATSTGSVMTTASSSAAAPSNIGESFALASITPSPSTTMSDSDSIAVSDQPAGEAVAITSLSFSSGHGWVAIWDGTGKRFLGAARFSSSDASGTVPLLKPTVSGNVYEAILYADTADGSFDIHTNALIVGADNNPIAASFIAQ